MRIHLLKHIFFAFLLMAVHLLSGQQDTVLISLKNEVKSAKNDSAKIYLHQDISNYFMASNLDSALRYAELGLEVAQEADYPPGIMEMHLQVAYVLLTSGDIAGAEAPLKAILEVARKYDSLPQQVVPLRVLGNIAFTLGEYPDALSYFNEGLAVAIEVENHQAVVELYSNLGHVHLQSGENDLAYPQFVLSREYAEQHGVTSMIPNSLSNMSLIEKRNGNHDKSYKFALQIIELRDSIPESVNFIPAAYDHIATHFNIIEQYDSALFYFDRMLESLDNVDKSYYGPTVVDEIRAYRGIGSALIKLEQYSRAESFLKIAMDKAIDAQFREQESVLANLLSVVYENTNRPEMALRYFKTYKSISDSLFGEKKVRELTEVRMEYEFSEKLKEQELEQAKKEVTQKRKENLYVIIIIAAVGLIIIITLLYRLQHSRRKTAEAIQEKTRLDLDFKNQELTSNVLSMLKKNELLISISDNLKKAIYGSKSIQKDKLKEIIKEIEISSKEIGWEEFELRFTEVHADFYNRLTSRFPNLSNNEKRLCAFIRLNMSTKDISAITFQSYHSIVQARSRMRKKMELEDNDSLTELLNKL